MAIQANYDKPSVLEIAGDYVKTPEGLNELVVEPAVTALKWTEIAVTALSEIVKGPKEIFVRAGHILLWAELPTQIMKLGRSIVKLQNSIASHSLLLASDKAAKVYVNATFMTGLVADAAQILVREHLLILSNTALVVLQVVGFLGSAALLIKAGRGIKKQVFRLIENKAWTPKFNLALIELISKVCLAVVAIFTMLAFFYSLAPFTWIILVFSTILLILSLISHFYEKTHFPDKTKVVEAKNLSQ